MNVLITIWICFLQTGQTDRPFFNRFAHVKQATKWAVLPWTIFPFRGLFRHTRQGFSNSLLFSRGCTSFSVHLTNRREGSLSSHPRARSKESIELLEDRLGLTTELHKSLGRTIGADIVLRQSGTSMPFGSSLLCIVAMLDVDSDCISLGQSENQSFLKAQQRKQYRLIGELNFLHLIHCQLSCWTKRSSQTN